MLVRRYYFIIYLFKDLTWDVNGIMVSKVVFIILSPSAIEANHPGLMTQFDLFAIINPT